MRTARPERGQAGRGVSRLAPTAMIVAAVVTAGSIAVAGCASSTTASTPTTAAPAPGATEPPRAAPAAVVRADVPVLTVKVKENSSLTFDAPDTVPAGWVEIDLVNNGQLAHQASLGKVRDGAPVDVAEQIMATDPVTGIGSLQEAGGANTVAGGATGRAIVSLDPGTYYLYCMVPDVTDQEPHARHGMVRKLVVTPVASGGTVAATPPVSGVAGTITMKDYGFTMPEPFAGKGWYEVTNDGPQPHELTVVALAPGQQAKQVKQYFVDVAGGPLSTPTVSGPPSRPKPYTDAGGMSSIGPGTTSYVWFDLVPGEYVAMCYVPDVPAPGRTGTPDFKAHFVHDMWQPFTIV